ncbi:MAG TPA: hypothetical protein PKA77_03365 [Chitinophagaceae bacterium]|nr:hypothetical protein [Chitinophagaceae bacterium]
MPDIFDLIKTWWKQILSLTILSVIVTVSILLIKPALYLSTATALPASSFASDKSRLFNENIEALYSALGTPDDLDIILGTASLDTVFAAVAKKTDLVSHYKMQDKGENADAKTVKLLKKRSSVTKNEYGNLKVKVWDTNKEKAAVLANEIMNLLSEMHQNLMSEGNKAALHGLIDGRQKILTQADSARDAAKRTALILRTQEYEKLIGEYQLMIDSKPPALIIVEKAKPSGRPDKPNIILATVASGALGFLFSLLAVLILQRRKNITG